MSSRKGREMRNKGKCWENNKIQRVFFSCSLPFNVVAGLKQRIFSLIPLKKGEGVKKK